MTASMGSECDTDGIRVGLAMRFATEFAIAVTSVVLEEAFQHHFDSQKYAELSAQGRQR